MISSGPTCAHRAAGCPMPRRSVLIVFDSIIQARASSQARDGKNKCDCVSKTTLRAQKQEMENRCDIASKTGLHTQTRTVKTCHFSLSVRPVCLFETDTTSGRAPVVVTRVGQDIWKYSKAWRRARMSVARDEQAQTRAGAAAVARRHRAWCILSML